MSNDTQITSHPGLVEVTLGDSDLRELSELHGEPVECCTVWLSHNSHRIVRIVLDYTNGERDCVDMALCRCVKHIVERVLPHAT